MPVVAALTALLGVSLCFRVVWLHRIPGINGDEAWYGVQFQRWLAGGSSSFLTPSRLPVNPMLLVTEMGLLRFLGPSFAVLRSPIVIWACVGLGLTYWLHRWVFGDRVQALLVAALTACLPAHLAYSRMCWDTSFGLVTLPLVLYATLKLAAGEQVRRSAGLFLVGSVLSLWVHVTNAVFVAVCLLALAWQFRRDVWRLVEQLLPCTLMLGGAAAVAVVALAIAGWRLGWWLLVRADMRYAGLLIDQLGRVRVVGDLILGPRVYEYFAGVPRPGWAIVVYPLLLVVASGGLVVLHQRGSSNERAIVFIVGLVMGLTVLLGSRLRLGEPSCERYVLYWVPLGVGAWVRSVGRLIGRFLPGRTWLVPAVHLGVSCVFLVQFWCCYFQPLQHQTYSELLHRTFRTGPQEPKADAAEAIRRRSPDMARGRVIAEDWWCQYPVPFLLGSGVDVATQVERPDRALRVFVVGYSDGKFAEGVRDRMRSWGWRLHEQEDFRDVTGRP
ncbi:MAG: hypothetical protein HY000_31930, partial [Planctomycetes bacterium]|nr:hypothetical protein [Planctomycetota bacterium]